ncbi:MAG: hypothetical protein GY854_29335 [Deltaproteobacteria bacterium]|nr:hypothetical protein [Deltaproteobacteria bacterium]
MDETNVANIFGHGIVQSSGVVRVISQLDEFVNFGSAACTLMMWSRKKENWYNFNIGWTAIRLVCNDSGMFALGVDGRVLSAGPSGVSEEMIDESDQGPSKRGEIKDMCLIGDYLYVVGACGQVYRREGPDKWVRWDKGIENTDVELNAIHGLDGSDVYAVGASGGIWRCVDGAWKQLESPTDTTLCNVRVVEPGLAYMVGEKGVLVRCDQGTCRVVQEIEAKEDLVGIEWFDGKLYVAGESCIYVLNDSGLESAKAGYGPGFTFGHLSANDGVMWSFGKNHLFRTDDGTRWHNATPHTTLLDPVETGPRHGQSACGCAGGSHTGGGSFQCS